MIIIDILFIISSLYCVSVALYFFTLTLAAFFFHKKTATFPVPPAIAVLIPAHNEELQIEKTLQQVYKSGYPEDRYSVMVIADNCDDRTAEFARAAGATVFERNDTANRGKGQALDWFLRQYTEAYGAFQIVALIDADALMSESYLSEVASSLSHPDVQVVQGYNGVSNPEDNWRTAISTAAFNVFNHLRPAGRNVIGGTAGLKGNGMAFRTPILKKYGWPAHSIVEDLEFSLQLLHDGILIHYNPDALVVSEMAIEKKQLQTQRERWEGGRLEIFKKNALCVFKKFAGSGSIKYLDEFMELITPPLSLFLIIQSALFALTLLHYHAWTPVFIAICAVEIFYVLSGQILRKTPLSVWIYLLAAPFYILSKLPIYLSLALRGKVQSWKRTKRKSELKDIDKTGPDES
ncbi:MAG: glycosyltransferase [Nitrospira sp.]|nr:glycosyltransferase [bacterium]MBL7047948.1 glycosyltransferase [Nitrospira sp.]